MYKKDYIRTLRRVKIVLGNGFDLRCGLHTTYSDYYCKNYHKYLYIQDLYFEYSKTDKINFDFQDEKIKLLNVWDIFFALNSSKYPKMCKQRWCDIEKMMLSSFANADVRIQNELKISGHDISKINWNTINDLLFSNKLGINHTDRFVVLFIKAKIEYQKRHLVDLYQFLLDELKDFEKQFGIFIYNQLHDSFLEETNHGEPFLNNKYIMMAQNTLNELCDKNNIVCIDSFNYSYIDPMVNRTQYINGSWEDPIFGVDSIFEPEENEYIFTKSSRRIDSDLFNTVFETKKGFENLIIYGHSLDSADYSYFFPAFDKLKLTDSLSTNVVVFAYSIYDKNESKVIRCELKKAISDIMYAYAISKNLSDPKRFLDSLSTQRRILTYEIPNIKREEYPHSFNDQEWYKIYKEIDSLTDDVHETIIN